MLNENTDLIQLISPDDVDLYSHDPDGVEDSEWDEFPTKDSPLNKYKYVSFSLVRDTKLKEIVRKTYSLFDWLADIGGLIRAVLALGQIIMYPFSTYELQSLLLWMLVRVVPSIHQNR